MWIVVALGILTPAAFPEEAPAGEWAVVEDARDGVLDRIGLLEAALVLSNPRDPESREGCLEKYCEIVESARREEVASRSPLAKVRHFVRQTHACLLQGQFDPECISLEEAFTSGRHNCVTSLVLVLEFCRREQIPARGMQQGSHVWLQVEGIGGGEIETTTLESVQLDEGKPSPISDVQLLSRLLYNQARGRHQQGDPAGAAQRLEWCLLVDPDFTAAERNLRIVLANWAISAADSERFSEALAVTRRAIARFPDAPEFPRHAAAVRRQWGAWRRASAAGSEWESGVGPIEPILTE